MLELTVLASASCSVLTKFAEEANIDKWYERENWLSDRGICSWWGVACNALNYVTKVSLQDNGLQQSAESEIDLIKLLSGLSNLKVCRVAASDTN